MCTAAAGGYTAALLRLAVPPGGLGAATPAFYSGVSLALPAGVTAAYLAMCFLGPRVMAARSPLACREAMLVYNAYQALFNAACVAVLAHEVWANNLRLFANPGGVHWRDKAQYGRIAAVIWLHYNNKVRPGRQIWSRHLLARGRGTRLATRGWPGPASPCPAGVWSHPRSPLCFPSFPGCWQYVELLDSLFMVLRKKSDQLSFLHCYHHCLLIWAWLYCMLLSGCVDTFFGAGCNAAIHVLMYSYYLLSALGIPCGWKRYLTVAQMAQFVACAGQSLTVLFTPDACPPALPLTQLFVMVNMLFLFGRFYRVRMVLLAWSVTPPVWGEPIAHSHQLPIPSSKNTTARGNKLGRRAARLREWCIVGHVWHVLLKTIVSLLFGVSLSSHSASVIPAARGAVPAARGLVATARRGVVPATGR